VSRKKSRKAYLEYLRKMNRIYLENIQRLKERQHYAPQESPVVYSDAVQLNAVLQERVAAKAGEGE
jgi:hypothetical protein